MATFFTLGFATVNAQNCHADFYNWSNNLQATFMDSSFSTSGNHNYSWSFGDGNSSNQINPVHNYALAGTYTVCLMIQDSLCFDSICKSITVTGNTPPTPCMASFTSWVNSNNTVNFTGSVSGGTAPYTFLWSFGGSSGNSSTVQSPTFTYASPGSYAVVFTVTDANGTSCSMIDSITVNTCSSDFSYSVGSNGVVSFTNNSTPNNAGIAFDWNFGDSSPNSGQTNPTHTYAVANSYIVSLNLYDSLTNCSSTYYDTVTVTIGSPNSCNASYTIAKDSSTAFGVILYNTSSNFGSHFYTWDFGDGTTGSGRTPIHQYQNFGSYVVCLTITDSLLNCTSTFCDTVGMDTLGNLKAGFGLSVQNPLSVGIDEVNNFNNIVLFPNPATNQISIDLTAVQNNLNIQVMDISGRIVMERANQNPGNIEVFEISSLESGLYFMVLNNGSEQKIEKFIKQ